MQGGEAEGAVGKPNDGGVTRAADRLRLPVHLWEEIRSHLAAELPNEGVGLLAARLAREGDDLVAIATRFFTGRNRRASPTRYDLDVRDLVAALREIEAAGEVLGGIVHSHPLGAPTPSRTDLAEAFYPESLMLIVSLAGPVPELRAWKLEGEPGVWTPHPVPVDLT